MKLVSLFFFFINTVLLSATPIQPDSLLKLLQKNEVEEVISRLTPTSELSQEKEVYVLMLAHYMQDDTVNYRNLRSQILAKELSENKAQELIHFVFESGFRFVTNREIFFYVQNFGIDLSKTHQEPRAQFSFLQQKFSMFQMTNQNYKIPNILGEMQQLSTGKAYLEYQTDMHHSLYYCGQQHDSCTYYFEKYFANAKNWLGRANPFFLNVQGYTLKKDSTILAGAVTEYAKYFRRKGDLKKAGELLVQSLQLIPDTSTVVLLNIRTQLALANIYTDLVNPARALFYIEKAITLCEEHKLERLRKTTVASAFAHALMADGQFDKAGKELQTAFQEYPVRLNCQDPKNDAFRLALNSAFRNDYTFCRLMIDTANKIECQSNPSIWYYQAMAEGALAGFDGDYRQGKLQLTDAYNIAKSSYSIGGMKDAIYQQYLLDKQYGRLEESIQALEKYTHMKDSLYRTGQEVALFDIEAAYQRTLQDETIARLDAENALTSSKLSSQKRNLVIAGIVLFVLSFMLFILWRLYKKVATTNTLLSKAVEEKNILLREIHHRVKNNLQVISSLLKLQSGYIKDDAAIQAIAEGRSRVQSMALLHQNLYTEDNITGVNMEAYFNNLIQGLFDTYNISPDRIQLHKNISSIELDVDTVVPLGLITNELISNALKHAFPNNTKGNLFIDLFEQSGNLILKVRDDGSGLTSSSTKEGFGNKLIQSLSQKLEADITTRSTGGTEITLTIKAYRKAA